MRRFNTEGPIRPEDHYHVPPLERVDLDQILDMIQRKRYFVLHAPRQTGKTSALLVLRDLLNRGEQGDFRYVYVNVEAAQAHREDLSGAMRTILGALADHALLSGGRGLAEHPDEFRPGRSAGRNIDALEPGRPQTAGAAG